jgi:hypothetical protein
MTKEQLKQLEADLWSAADNLRANSDLKSSEYATPVLGLIFLKFADNNYRRHEVEIIAEYQKLKGTRREKNLSDIAIEKCGFYLPDHARYDQLRKSGPEVGGCGLNFDVETALSAHYFAPGFRFVARKVMKFRTSSHSSPENRAVLATASTSRGNTWRSLSADFSFRYPAAMSKAS